MRIYKKDCKGCGGTGNLIDTEGWIWNCYCGNDVCPPKVINIEESTKEIDEGRYKLTKFKSIPVTFTCEFETFWVKESPDHNRFFKTLPKTVSEEEMKIVREKGIKQVYYFYDDKIYADKE